MQVRCDCCGNPTPTHNNQPVICVRCVMELESCRPVTPLPAGD